MAELDFSRASDGPLLETNVALTITRKAGEAIRIGEDIIIVLRDPPSRSGQVRLEIHAPRELYIAKEAAQQSYQRPVSGTVPARPA